MVHVAEMTRTIMNTRKVRNIMAVHLISFNLSSVQIRNMRNFSYLE